MFVGQGTYVHEATNICSFFVPIFEPKKSELQMLFLVFFAEVGEAAGVALGAKGCAGIAAMKDEPMMCF